MEKKLITLRIDELKPYKNNAKRHTKKQINQIIKSIETSNYVAPIEVDENNMIISGHGRYEALKQMGKTEIEVLQIKGFPSEQAKKAYMLNTNKLNMSTGFDTDILYDELKDITDINMEDFGFNIDAVLDDIFKPNERIRANNTYNLDLVDFSNSTNDFWQMPNIENNGCVPSALIDLNILNVQKNCETKGIEVGKAGIHCYVDDYKLERLWKKPEKYIDILQQYECALSPDFSLYLDMPMPMKIWNVYRSRQIGQYWQSQGIKVVPTIQWAEPETFEFCFKGIPKGSIVSVSTIGVKRNKDATKIWQEGMDAMISEIEPSTILVYGGELDYDYGQIDVRYFENKVTERMKQ